MFCLGGGTLHSVFMLFWCFPDTAAVSLRLFDYFCRDAACSVRIVVRVGVFVFFCYRTLHAASLLPRRVGRRFYVYKVSFPFSVFSFPFVLIHPLRFARPPVSGGQSAGAVAVFRFPFVTNSPSGTGGVPRSGEGVDKVSFLTSYQAM